MNKKEKYKKLVVENLTKRYDNINVVNSISFEVASGDFCSLLGPSGCGKTTTLRMIAGLTNPNNGKIYINGSDVTDIPTHKRRIGFVFQNYALWPHMTVYDNIAFALKLKKQKNKTICERVKYLLDVIKLPGVEKRFPNELSGGQQQRIALARALCDKDIPILLLDEPLSNLDKKLRMDARKEIKRIQKELDITIVYVTHDQEESLEMSDNIIVMSEGNIMQKGTPESIYKNPENRFVASFIGDMNFIDSKIIEINNNNKIVARSEKKDEIVFNLNKNQIIEKGDNVLLGIRPESINIYKKNTELPVENKFIAKIDQSFYIGDSIKYILTIHQEIKLETRIFFDKGIELFNPGEEVVISIPESTILYFK